MSAPSPDGSAGYDTGARLKIQLFGPFAMRLDNVLLPALRTRKGAWLLSLLVLHHPRPVDRVWLAATLWPDSDHMESLRNLRDSLYDLRKALGAQAKRLSSPTSGMLTVDLHGADVDLLTFDACLDKRDAAGLEKAILLYGGGLLEGCHEEWVIPERNRRQQMCLDALETLAGIESNDGRVAQAVQRLRMCVDLDPFRETAQQALMALLASIGDYAGATQVYRAFRLHLHEELQSSPAPETTAFYEQIRVRARRAALGKSTVLRSPSSGSAHVPADRIREAALDIPNISHNLPRAVTSFIGRGQEIAKVRTLLETAPLLTLTGSGGSGKTRLALQVAGELYDTFPDGVWLVELASLSEPLLVPQGMASVFAIHEQPGIPLLRTLCDTLASRRLLLVLDNCEHLLAACGQMASALLRSCPGVSLLATSRERLGIAGEQTYRVPSLSLPDPNLPATVESIGQVEAVRLFVERATLSKAEFVVTSQNAPALVSVCRRLDGIPLALELAAARVRSLSVEDIVARLEGRFDLLTGGDRSALPRHQTLRALIDWSYDLLNSQERQLLQRLSVFPGGWTLEAAEGVGAGLPLEEREVLELLTSLVDKSLVLAEERDGTVRYRMFDTLKLYAAEKLHATGDAEAVHVRRRTWFLALAEQAAKFHWNGIDEVLWLQRLETEHDNLRATLAWGAMEGEGVQEILQMAANLWRFWMVRGYASEGREHLRLALAHKDARTGTVARSRALGAAGNLVNNQGDYAEAWELYQESLTIRQTLWERSQDLRDKRAVADILHSLGGVAYRLGDASRGRTMYEKSQSVCRDLVQRCRELGDKQELAQALDALVWITVNLADYAAARTLQEESLSLRRELGDRRGIGNAFSNLGKLAQREGDFTAARAYYEQSAVLKRALGDKRGMSLTSIALGEVAYRQADYRAALTVYETILPVFRALGDRESVARCLEGMASVLSAQGEVIQAVRQWSAAATLRKSIGAPLSNKDRTEVEQQIEQALQKLGANDFASAWSAGQALTWEQSALFERPNG